MTEDHPRDRFITVYGRKPVLEALAQPDLPVHKVLLAKGSRGDVVDRIRKLARKRGLRVKEVPASQVNRISRNARQDQGVVADVEAPRMGDLEAWLPGGGRLLALDGVTTPANVGMAIRSAVGAGLQGVVLPRAGTAKLSPMVVKASAGTAYAAPILRCADAAAGVEALRGAGYAVFGLQAGGTPLFELELPPNAVFVLGNESDGLSEGVRRQLTGRVGIPMAAGVESLNVAAAATLVAYEVLRRG